MAKADAPDGDARTSVAAHASSETSIRQTKAELQPESRTFAAYSLSSPEFRQDIRKITAGEQTRANTQVVTDGSASPLVAEVPTLLKAPKPPEVILVPGVPALLKPIAQIEVTSGPQKPAGADHQVLPSVPVAPAEQMEDKNKTVDPCTKKVVNAIPAPADMPKAMEPVLSRDPELFKQIQAKVTDPRYTGELGNITVSTHDKKGRVNGCVFVQNVPYWESGAATQALLDVKKELATKGKKLDADPLNGAGRSLAQEEAIVWRNSGVHARVGKSNHGFGKAEDFKPDANPDAKRQPWQDPSVNATLHAHGWRQGDSWGPLKNDLHHWSFVGPGPATDGHPAPHNPTHVTHHKHR